MSENQRLKYLQKTLNFANQTDFAAALCIKQGSLSDVYRAKSGIKVSDSIKRILEKNYAVNLDWLETGDGEMFKDQSVEDVEKNNPCEYMVPVYNFDAVGGMNASNDVIDAQAYVEKYVPFENARYGDIGVRVTGNSMIPTYSPGSLLLVRKVERWQEYFGYGHTFVLFLRDGRRILKEVRRYDQDPKDYVLCVSHNENYQAEELPKSFIVDVYKVILSQTYEGF